MSPLRSKLFWLSFWVIGFAVFMTGLLLHFKYQSVFTGLQRDRVVMVAQEITDITQKNLSLGQDFREIARLQDVIERRRETDPVMLAIEVAATDGKLLYATDRARLGTHLGSAWLAQFGNAKTFTALVASDDEALVATRINNSFEQLAGIVVIHYSRKSEHTAMRAFHQRLWPSCGGVFMAFTLLLYTVLVGLWRRTDAELACAAKFLGNANEVASAPGDLRPALKRELETIAAQLDAATAELQAAQAALTP